MAKTGTRLTADIAAVIKRARLMNYNYETIASYWPLNQGRIADVMKERRFADVPPANDLPSDFPPVER